MTIFLLTLLLVISIEYRENERIKKYWKDWENNSFEYKGWRISKDFYELIDGQLVEKSTHG